MKKLITTALLTSIIIISASASIKVTGRVTDINGKGIAYVPVSDGHQFVYTDKNGKYELKGDFDQDLVFVSTPNGYEPVDRLDGNRPKFWVNIGNHDTIANFTLKEINEKKPVAFLAVADLQISDRAGDRDRLKNLYVPDLNKSIDSLRNIGLDPFILTLGDQTCDFYWSETGYCLPEFNKEFTVNCPVYLSMGNHDNDPWKPGDLGGSSTFRAINGPAYYSFNRGGAHFVVLDNMVYKNYDALPDKPGKRDYTTALYDDQLDWLKNDLKSIKDKNTPIFVAMHGILLTYPVGEDEKIDNIFRMEEGGEALANILKPFNKVNVMTGHAHNNHYQHTADFKIREYNVGGANGTWWPARLRPNQPNIELCRDGSPWGYMIWNLSADKPSHVYKGFDLPVSHQMRVYDLNTLTINDETLTKDYLPGDPKNKNRVLANIWAYEDGCKVKFYENGKELKVKRIRAQDPYQFNKYLIPLKESGVDLWSPLLPEHTAHMFEAYAETSDAPITVEFKDLSGNTFTKTLERKIK
ncbi:MAG: calcineurin-like phosphoesterase family protein [Roseburia sp.]|nr:calcineurin-like phosphoesterase family protein [Roseburia sp.]